MALISTTKMKYNININQLALTDTNLDLKDAAILDFLVIMYGVDNPKIKKLTIEEKGKTKTYVWINFNHLIKEMPLLRIKQKASISLRVKKIEDAGFIKTFLTPDRTMYYRLTKKVNELFFTDPVSKNKQGVSKNKQPLLAKTNSTIITQYNNNTSNNIATQSVAWDFEEKLRLLLSSKRKDLQIIGLYWRAKRFEFDNKKQYEEALKRELRPAKKLVGYTLNQIIGTLNYLKKTADYKWTLESVHKNIDDVKVKNNTDLSKMSSSQLAALLQ